MAKRNGSVVKDSNNSVSDAFRRAEERYLASLPKPGDHIRFLEAARGILADDPDLKRLGSRARSKLVRGSLNTLPERDALRRELLGAVRRATSKANLSALNSGNQTSMRIAGLRILMAHIIVQGLGPQTDSVSYDRAMLFLHEAQRDIEQLVQQERGSHRTATVKDEALIRQIRDLAIAWRRLNPRKHKAMGYRRLFADAKRDGISVWSNHEALRSWMNRKGIVI